MASAAKAWKLTWRGRTWSLEDHVTGATPVTGKQVLQVAVELGSDSWDTMDPARSPNALMTWLAVLASDGTPDDLARCYGDIAASNAAELLRALSFTENGTG